MNPLVNSGEPGYIRLTTITGYAEDESAPPPQFSFVFPGIYRLAPFIAWTTPATPVLELDNPSAGNIDPDADITDADGNLVRIQLFSVRDDTGVQTVHLDIPIAPASVTTLQDAFDLANVSGTLNFAGQVSVDTYHTLSLRVTDADGYVIESSVTLVRLATGGGGLGLGGVTYDPIASQFIRDLTIALTVGGSATRIHMAFAGWGSTAPTSYTTFVGTSTTQWTASSQILWARASDGVNHSAWQSQIYYKSNP